MMEADYSGPDRRRGGPDRRTPDQRTKILLVDDHALFRMGMRQILEREPDFDILGEAEDGRDAFNMAIELSPDIVLLDLSLPAPGGIDDDPAHQARSAQRRASSPSPSPRTRISCSRRSRPARPRSSSRTSTRTTWSRSSAAFAPAST